MGSEFIAYDYVLVNSINIKAQNFLFVAYDYVLVNRINIKAQNYFFVEMFLILINNICSLFLGPKNFWGHNIKYQFGRMLVRVDRV